MCSPSNSAKTYRKRMHDAGYRAVNHWKYDTRSPQIAEEIRKECRDLKNNPVTEFDVLDFAEDSIADIQGWK
ncbi:antitoxin MazE-like protein [Bartonella sp. DGB2]|uniref:antitoxin MazE-like protein n=1 Tax=Bartonella sp. DGB2 TaxID=3388426 RepID=UPI0039901B95